MTVRSHRELAELVRELLLAGHLIDRSGMPHLIERYGRDGMAEVAIAEWMGASPVYSRRMQQLLDFESSEVATICKNIQLDIGAPLEFLDFRFTVHHEQFAEFQLAHCGALMDVEPMGEDYVFTMCHTIEDPTFDATAAATNPRAQIRPLHRPPRDPADRHPHCHWTITVEPEADPFPYPSEATRLGRSRAAQLPLAERPSDLSAEDGVDNYRGPVEPDLRLSRFSSATLAAIADEVNLQGHLLARSYMLAVADRSGVEEARTVGGRQACGVAGVVAKRLARALGVTPDLVGLAEVLSVHPLLNPRTYAAFSVYSDHSTDAGAGDGVHELSVTIDACPALDEEDGLSWPSILVDVDDRALTAIAAAVVPHSRVTRADSDPPVARWVISVDPDGEAARQFDEVTLTEFSTGANFAFSRPA